MATSVAENVTREVCGVRSVVVVGYLQDRLMLECTLTRNCVVHQIVKEPASGLFYIKQHIRRTIPKLSSQQVVMGGRSSVTSSWSSLTALSCASFFAYCAVCCVPCTVL